MPLPTIKLKKSSVLGRKPDSADLAYGELAINYNDGKLYYKNSSNIVKTFLDSGNTVDLIDSAYIQARQLATPLGGFDSADFDSMFAAKSTTNLSEGTNKYYTFARSESDITDIVDSAYIQFLQLRYLDSAKAIDLIDSAYVNARLNLSLFLDSAEFNSMFAAKSTTNLSEGTNKYYTKARADSDDKYPTTFTYTAGTTAGPTGSLTGNNLTAISFAAIPSAGASASGIITTGAQTIAGAKTFNSTISGSIDGNASTSTTLATGRNFSLTGEVTAPAISFNGSGAVALATTIATDAVDSSNILTLSVSSAKIQTGAITTEKFATGAVDSAALGALSVSSAKLQASIPDSKLATISTASKVSNSATTATNLNTASTIVARDASGNFTAGTITAALTGNASTATTLATGQNFSLTGEVTAPAISFNGSGAVALATTIVANAVDSSNILALSISSGKIQSGAITTEKFATGAVDSAALGALSVSSAKIQSGAITTAKFATGAVDSAALGALSVSSAKIQNNAVTLGTQTTGNYVSNVSAVNGIKIAGTAGEGWTPTVSLDSTGTGTIGNLTVGSNLTVSGNFTVSGTTTSINTETITLNDNIIVLNNNATGVPGVSALFNAGIEVERGDSSNVQVLWNEVSNRWTFTNDGTIYYNIPTSDEYIDSATSKFPTTFTYTAGTTAGPTGSLTGTNLTAISFAAIPSAGAGASGIVTTDSQTFAGIKTFSSTIVGSVDGNAGTATTLATSRNLWGQSFNGGAAVTGSLTSVGDITGTGAVTLTSTAGVLTLAATSNNNIVAKTNGTERMRIDSSGAVGIGTISPATKLDVAGVASAISFENPQTITSNYTITTSRNAMNAGPVTIDDGVVVTVPSGSVWTIV